MKPLVLLSISCLLLSMLTSCKNTLPVEPVTFQHTYKFNSDIEEKLEKDTVAWKHQLAASDYATKGDYSNALALWDVAFPGRFSPYTPQQLDSLRARYRAMPAADYLVEQAKQHQVVIINEAHHSSLHRFFTRSLLQRLYDSGYRNLGLEALTNGKLQDSLLHDRKYPVMETGYYTQDPQFGNLIRTALEIGYHVFPYETTNRSNGKPREIDQAKNIQQVMESRPGEKFLIHCGFGHVVEGDHESWEKAMAGRLAEYTGIDPLTIDQVHYSEKSKPERSHPLLHAFDITQPSVLLDQNNRPLRFERGSTWADIAVLHPFTSYASGRPNWLFGNGNKIVKLDLRSLDLDLPVFVMAFREGDDVQQAVPVDIFEVTEQSPPPWLALPKGSYDVLVVNKKEEARKLKIKVK